MKFFLVGGAVRDELLGREVVDRDWVVVGGTPEKMEQRGFTKVGADFPVFLHPTSKEEFALARTERKVGPGMNGFEVDFDKTVTLTEDLSRRDLTVNAMARDEKDNIIDPFNGRQDLEDKILRPVSEAFKEDPVRVLRAFRFMARFGPSWKMDPRIHTWAKEMLVAGEFDAVPSERFVAEIRKAMGEPNWWLFFGQTVVDILAHRFGQTLVPGNVTQMSDNAVLNFHDFCRWENALELMGHMEFSTDELKSARCSLALDELVLNQNPQPLHDLAARDFNRVSSFLLDIREVKVHEKLCNAFTSHKFVDFKSDDLEPQAARELLEAARMEDMVA